MNDMPPIPKSLRRSSEDEEKPRSHAQMFARRQKVGTKILQLQREYAELSDRLKAALDDDPTA